MAAKLKIKKGDKVVVLAGKDKGKQGEVLQCDAEGKPRRCVGRECRHAPQQADSDPGGRHRSAELPMHISNVALRDPKDGKPTRVGFKTLGRQEGPCGQGQERRSMADERKPSRRPRLKPAAKAEKAPKKGPRRLALKTPTPGCQRIMCRVFASTMMKS